jgi:hypothetical protein
MQSSSIMRNIILALVLGVSGAGYMAGCSTEVEHTETDKPNWIGSGRTHTEDTTYRNPDGSYSTEHEKTRTNP